MAPRWLAGSRALARRLLPLTMGVVVATFVASTIYSELLLTTDVDAIDIASNSAPSIAELANARAELRGLGRDAERVLAAADPTAAAQARADYRKRRASIDAALAEYARTPNYRGEEELYAAVPAQLAELDARVAGGAAHRSVDATIDELDWSLHQVSELNRRQLLTSATAVARLGRRKNLYAFLLDGFGILVAFAATVLAVRTVDRFITAQRRRTHELEHLAIQVGHEISNPLTPIQVALRMMDEHDGDEMQRNSLIRARRSLVRIEESIARLTAFARAGIPSNDTSSTALAPALTAVARPIGLTVDADADLQVQCPPRVLHDVLNDLFAGSVPPGGGPPVAVDVRATRHHVRVTLSCAANGKHPGDPFDPQLHNPGSEHPGIDLRLATVRRMVEACGGAVGASDGSGLQRVWIELPRA